MSPTLEQVKAGQAVYSRRTLRIYDWLVLGISNRWIWKCPTRELLKLYNEHVSANHLDVGVGTGYFLDRCQFPSDAPRVALIDLNENCLQAAAARITRYSPERYSADILQPIELDIDKFDSVGLNYVLHCLPGSMTEKSVALSHLAELLNPGGVLFGSTLLHGGVARNVAARRLMRYYNGKQIFSNQEDDLNGLRNALEQRFSRVRMHLLGCAALFAVRK